MYKYANNDIPCCLECHNGRLTRNYWVGGIFPIPGSKKYDYGLVQCDCCETTYWAVVNKKTDEIRLMQKVETFNE